MFSRRGWSKICTKLDTYEAGGVELEEVKCFLKRDGTKIENANCAKLYTYETKVVSN